jgi:hypothetical protein
LLNLLFIKSETGKDQLLAVYNILEKKNFIKNVYGICWDAISSNMGRLQGVCDLLK